MMTTTTTRSSIRKRTTTNDDEAEGSWLMEHGEASMSMADVDTSGVGKKNATRTTAADMSAVVEKGDETTTTTSKTSPKFGIVALATYTMCAALSVTGVLAMLGYHSLIVYVAMTIGIGNSANVVRQRWLLEDGDALRALINEVRQDVNELHNLNGSIAKSNDEIQFDLDRLSHAESSLDEILKAQGHDSSTFIAGLNDNKDVLDRMQTCLKQEAVQEIIEQVVKSDHDQDFHIDPEEIDMLILRLQTLEGLILCETAFRKKLAKTGYNVHSVLNMCHRLMEDEDDDGDGKMIEIDQAALSGRPL